MIVYKYNKRNKYKTYYNNTKYKNTNWRLIFLHLFFICTEVIKENVSKVFTASIGLASMESYFLKKKVVNTVWKFNGNYVIKDKCRAYLFPKISLYMVYWYPISPWILEELVYSSVTCFSYLQKSIFFLQSSKFLHNGWS